MKRTVYEAPVTELFRIELEGNFCASAEFDNPGDNGIENQTINTGFDDDVNVEEGGFVSGSWGN